MVCTTGGSWACIEVSGANVWKFILASDSLIARLTEEVDRAAFVEDWFTFRHGYVVTFTAHPFRAHIALDQVHIFLVTVFKVTRKFIIRGLLLFFVLASASNEILIPHFRFDGVRRFSQRCLFVFSPGVSLPFLPCISRCP